MILLGGLVAAGLILLMYALMVHPQKSRKSTALIRETRELKEANALLQKEAETLRSAFARAAEKGLAVYPRSSDGFREQTSKIIAGVDRLVRSTGVTLVRLEPQPREQRGSLAMYPFLVELKGGVPSDKWFSAGIAKRALAGSHPF